MSIAIRKMEMVLRRSILTFTVSGFTDTWRAMASKMSSLSAPRRLGWPGEVR
jgi:hypothetical protein